MIIDHSYHSTIREAVSLDFSFTMPFEFTSNPEFVEGRGPCRPSMASSAILNCDLLNSGLRQIAILSSGRAVSGQHTIPPLTPTPYKRRYDLPSNSPVQRRHGNQVEGGNA
jgi:hypothetical protein